MFFIVLITGLSIGLIIATFSYIANPQIDLISFDLADWHRRKWKERGRVLHLPSYYEGKEKYVVPEYANILVSKNELKGLYDE